MTRILLLITRSSIQLPGRTSAGRAGSGADLAGCVSVAEDFPSASGGLLPRLLPASGGLIARCLRRP